ncbi:MAG: hypothetical protein H0X39_16720 [Actinobacteria bacterium]|nr:hypothetical protein [Actinomycetota bacterium]
MTLAVTAPLYRAEVALGLGLTAIVEITEASPQDAPVVGAEWAAEIDWPRAQLEIGLSAAPSCYVYAVEIVPELICEAVVLNDVLGKRWGGEYGNECPRLKSHRACRTELAAEYLIDAVSQLRARAEADLAPLIAHVAKRAARLAQREATLTAGRTGRPLPVANDARPIETDDAPRTVAPDLTNDDSSQRFALLEIDSPPAKTARTRRKAA